MTGGSFWQGGVNTALRRGVAKSEKLCDSERTSALSFLSGASSDSGRYAPQNGEIVGSLKQLKGETIADLSALEKGLDRKTKHQGLMKAETKEIFVLTKAIEEKETLALTLEQSAKEAAQRHQDEEAQKQADEVVEVAKAVEAQEEAEAQPRPTRPPPWRDKLQSTGMHERKPKLVKILRPRRLWKQLSGPRLLSNKRKRPRRHWQPRPLGERKAADALEKQKEFADAQAKQLS